MSGASHLELTPLKLSAVHAVEILESNRRYVNQSPKGEPRLGKRGLYGAMGGRSPADRERAMLWILNQSDGGASLLDIAQRSGLRYAAIRTAAQELTSAGLLAAAKLPGKRKARAAGAARKRRKKSASGEKR